MADHRPDWYIDDDDSTWEQIKNAFKNDWEQTRHDLGSDAARDLNQDVDDTLKQAVGADDAFENSEQAFRFGHAARREFSGSHPTWNDDLESRLGADYADDFERDRESIRYAYDYDRKV